MNDDRVTVYEFSPNARTDARARFNMLEREKFHPDWDLSDDGGAAITLPVSEEPALRRLQRAKPQVWGEAPKAPRNNEDDIRGEGGDWE